MGRRLKVLLIEDSPGEARLLLELFRESNLDVDVYHALDGEQGLEILGSEHFSLLILDLNLPGISGWEVLDQLKSDPLKRSLPIVILTSSKVPEDVARAYDSHANCYIQKPTDLNQFRQVINQIESFWFKLVALPG